MGVAIFDERRPFNGYVILTNGSLGSTVDLAFSATERLRVDTIVATNTDTIDHLVQLNLYLGDQPVVGVATIVAGAGNGTIPTADVLALMGSVFVNGFALNQLERLQITLIGTDVTSPLAVTLVASGGFLP